MIRAVNLLKTEKAKIPQKRLPTVLAVGSLEFITILLIFKHNRHINGAAVSAYINSIVLFKFLNLEFHTLFIKCFLNFRLIDLSMMCSGFGDKFPNKLHCVNICLAC